MLTFACILITSDAHDVVILHTGEERRIQVIKRLQHAPGLLPAMISEIQRHEGNSSQERKPTYATVPLGCVPAIRVHSPDKSSSSWGNMNDIFEPC